MYANPACPAGATVRRWIGRYNTHGVAGLADRPRSGRPRLGSPRLAGRILRLLAEPQAWTIARLWPRPGRPAMSLRTLHRRVGEVAAWRRPRLVARWRWPKTRPPATCCLGWVPLGSPTASANWS